jgi:hypothetical protein
MQTCGICSEYVDEYTFMMAVSTKSFNIGKVYIRKSFYVRTVFSTFIARITSLLTFQN